DLPPPQHRQPPLAAGVLRDARRDQAGGRARGVLRVHGGRRGGGAGGARGVARHGAEGARPPARGRAGRDARAQPPERAPRAVGRRPRGGRAAVRGGDRLRHRRQRGVGALRRRRGAQAGRAHPDRGGERR
ncbi:MAG: UPF0758 family protein, partial [uncultured Gemmatimonadaceae bacterium]